MSVRPLWSGVGCRASSLVVTAADHWFDWRYRCRLLFVDVRAVCKCGDGDGDGR